MRISKSRFVAGVQCLKRLYLQVHQPSLAAALDDARRAVIEQGRQVGLVAQKAFPGGVIVEAGPTELAKAIKTTRDLVSKSEAPAIFEATFEHDGVLVRTDVLKRSGRFGHNLIEVKSSTDMKPHHAYDIGIQRHVLTGADVEINRASLMRLACVVVNSSLWIRTSRLGKTFAHGELPPGAGWEWHSKQAPDDPEL